MARFNLINKESNKIINIIELEEGGYTTDFIQHDNGSVHPIVYIDGKPVLTSKWLVPADSFIEPFNYQFIGDVYDKDFKIDESQINKNNL